MAIISIEDCLKNTLAIDIYPSTSYKMQMNDSQQNRDSITQYVRVRDKIINYIRPVDITERTPSDRRIADIISGSHFEWNSHYRFLKFHCYTLVWT